MQGEAMPWVTTLGLRALPGRSFFWNPAGPSEWLELESRATRLSYDLWHLGICPTARELHRRIRKLAAGSPAPAGAP